MTELQIPLSAALFAVPERVPAVSIGMPVDNCERLVSDHVLSIPSSKRIILKRPTTCFCMREIILIRRETYSYRSTFFEKVATLFFQPVQTIGRSPVAPGSV